ncbi:hypothetical protein CDCA_CDCA03G0896 [Cyanidium caldarium]|uniref:Reticulon-like protein n=1 Tax=Cyanidium caldarium TaxID=2771 RepID=A0AAV9IS11_CYACA|nr:hypothetical protein CDCA_CDCA03G0896 [Cyanidium caldarium]
MTRAPNERELFEAIGWMRCSPCTMFSAPFAAGGIPAAARRETACRRRATAERRRTRLDGGGLSQSRDDCRSDRRRRRLHGSSATCLINWSMAADDPRPAPAPSASHTSSPPAETLSVAPLPAHSPTAPRGVGWILRRTLALALLCLFIEIYLSLLVITVGFIMAAVALIYPQFIPRYVAPLREHIARTRQQLRAAAGRGVDAGRRRLVQAMRRFLENL